MRLKLMPLLAVIAMTSCSVKPAAPVSEPPVPYQYPAEDHIPDSAENSFIPLNYSRQHGLWLPYMDFEGYMYRRTEEEYRAAANAILDDAAAEGVNTVYFHIHPNGDAYYDSAIFPKGVFSDGSFDPLEIMTELAHEKGISIHGWINPLRMQTEEQAAELPENYIIKQWIDSGEPMVKAVNGRWYLDPSYDEVIELVSRTAAEIIENYAVDGIHIDDYFYPTADTEFDAAEFEKSGAADLGEWRRGNITRMVKALYDTVKTHDKRLKFSISPQGNIDTDMNSQFADVKLWCGTSGYADCMIPQLYYGFKNETCPFEATLRRWEELTTAEDVSLVIGLAGYKVGMADKWAGAAGESEWVDDPNVLQKQIEMTENSAADGYAVYGSVR